MQKNISKYLLIAGLLFCNFANAQQATIAVDLKKETGDMKPVWA